MYIQCISLHLGSLSHPLLLNKNNMGCSWFLWKQNTGDPLNSSKGPLSRLCGKNLAFRHWVGNLIKDEHDSQVSRNSLLWPRWWEHSHRLGMAISRGWGEASWGPTVGVGWEEWISFGWRSRWYPWRGQTIVSSHDLGPHTRYQVAEVPGNGTPCFREIYRLVKCYNLARS